MNKVIHFETFDVINKTIYAQLLWADILISINTESNQVKIVSMNNKHHFKHSVAKENKMYFADNLGHILMLHDTETNDEKLFELGCDEKSNNNIAAMEICDNNVFVISQYKGIICIFDTINEEMKNDYSLNRLLTEWYGDKIDFAIRSWRICDSLYFYITAGNICENFRYDLHTMRLEHIHSKCLSGKIMASYCFENKLYILKNDFDLTIWNTTNDIAEEIAMEDVYRLNDEIKCKNRFSTVAVTKRNIWLFPAGENKDIYVYDFDKKCGRIYDEYPLDFSYTYVKNWSKYADIKERNGCIYVAPRLSNYYLLIDIETGIGAWKSIQHGDVWEEYYQRLFNQGGILNENLACPLQAYLNHILLCERSTQKCQVQEISYGRSLYE